MGKTKKAVEEAPPKAEAPAKKKAKGACRSCTCRFTDATPAGPAAALLWSHSVWAVTLCHPTRTVGLMRCFPVSRRRPDSVPPVRSCPSPSSA